MYFDSCLGLLYVTCGAGVCILVSLGRAVKPVCFLRFIPNTVCAHELKNFRAFLVDWPSAPPASHDSREPLLHPLEPAFTLLI